MRAVVEGYRDALRRAGRETELGEGLCIGFHFQLAATQEEAIKAAAGYFEENLKMFGPLRLVRSLSEAQIDAMADPKRAPYAGLPTIEEAAASGAYLCGPPAKIIDTLMRLEKDYPGLERVSVSHPMGAPESLMLEQLEWFAARSCRPSPGERAEDRNARPMSDVLRPDAASALEAWRRRVSANREQAERLREGTPPRDFYAAVAPDFRANPRRTDEPALELLRALVRPARRGSTSAPAAAATPCRWRSWRRPSSPSSRPRGCEASFGPGSRSTGSRMSRSSPSAGRCGARRPPTWPSWRTSATTSRRSARSSMPSRPRRAVSAWRCS